LALANIGAACGLTDQQIANLLVVHRRNFPGKRKTRKGNAYLKYLSGRIRLARMGRQRSEEAMPEREQPDTTSRDGIVSSGGTPTDNCVLSAHSSPATGNAAQDNPEPESIFDTEHSLEYPSTPLEDTPDSQPPTSETDQAGTSPEDPRRPETDHNDTGEGAERSRNEEHDSKPHEDQFRPKASGLPVRRAYLKPKLRPWRNSTMAQP
jgi:hypothetical protein